MSLDEELMEAIAADKVDEIPVVIEKGVDLNSRCDQGASALFGAILFGNISVVCASC